MQTVGQHFADLSLVVLSACETALGGEQQSVADAEDLDGREISGIAQTFLDAGADAILASLWKVSDASTSQLMQQFYRELSQPVSQQNLTFSQALQEAQLSLLRGESFAQANDRDRSATGIRLTEDAQTNPGLNPDVDYAHPFYWAPFILIGNGL